MPWDEYWSRLESLSRYGSSALPVASWFQETGGCCSVPGRRCSRNDQPFLIETRQENFSLSSSVRTRMFLAQTASIIFLLKVFSNFVCLFGKFECIHCLDFYFFVSGVSYRTNISSNVMIFFSKRLRHQNHNDSGKKVLIPLDLFCVLVGHKVFVTQAFRYNSVQRWSWNFRTLTDWWWIFDCLKPFGQIVQWGLLLRQTSVLGHLHHEQQLAHL